MIKKSVLSIRIDINISDYEKKMYDRHKKKKKKKKKNLKKN